MGKDEIREKIAKQLPLLRQKYQVKRLGIFGSVIRGQQKRGSDVDVLVEFSSPIGFFDFIRLEDFLTEILDQKVDLVSKNALKPAIRGAVLRETLYV